MSCYTVDFKLPLDTLSSHLRPPHNSVVGDDGSYHAFVDAFMSWAKFNLWSGVLLVVVIVLLPAYHNLFISITVFVINVLIMFNMVTW